MYTHTHTHPHVAMSCKRKGKQVKDLAETVVRSSIFGGVYVRREGLFGFTRWKI